MKIKFTEELICLSNEFDFYSITPLVITVKVYYTVGFYFNTTRNRLSENDNFFSNTYLDTSKEKKNEYTIKTFVSTTLRMACLVGPEGDLALVNHVRSRSSAAAFFTRPVRSCNRYRHGITRQAAGESPTAYRIPQGPVENNTVPIVHSQTPLRRRRTVCDPRACVPVEIRVRCMNDFLFARERLFKN